MRSFDFGPNMMKYILLIVCLFFVVSAHSQGQQGTFTNPQGGTLIAQSADCSVVYSCVWMKLPNDANTTTITIGGTFSATILIEESGNGGVTFFTVATLSSAGLTTYATSGLSDIRVRVSAFTSGGVNVTINTGVNAGGNVSTSTTNNFTTQQNFLAGASTSSLNNIVMVDGKTYPCTTAGIRAAVSATPAGGTTYVPAPCPVGGSPYLLSATSGTEQILITNTNFICGGWGANLQLQSGAVSAPLLRIAPSGASGYVAYGIRVQDCQFSTVTGGLGTYAIQVDTTTTGSVGKLVIEHIYAGCTNTGTYYCQGAMNFGTGSIFFNNPTGTGGYYQSSISHSKLYGNIKMTRAGDSITVSDNEIIPNAAADIFYVDSYPGSTLFRFQNNFMRMPFRTATDTTGSSSLQSPIFDGNVWEPESSANLGFSVTETNNALLDLDGSATSNVTHASVTKNSFQPNANSYTLNAVRLNYAAQTNIGGKGYINFFGITTGGTCGAATCHAYITTANTTAGNLFNHNDYSIATWTGSSGSIMDDVATNTLVTDDWVNTPSTQLVSQGSGGGTNYYGSTSIAMEAYTGETSILDGNGSGAIGLAVSATPNAQAIPSGITTAWIAANNSNRPTVTGTGTCATSSTPLGGTSLGSIVCTGTSGAATITFTFPVTATDFWFCDIPIDKTTPGDLFTRGAFTNNSCSFNAAALVQNDVIVFRGQPY
jgi:hypothetical protein